MKSIAHLLLTAVLFLSTQAANAEPALLDKVIAIVGKDVVLLSELNERLAEVKQRAAAGNMALPPQDVLTQQIVEQLITEQLQLQTARRVGFSVSDDQVNDAIANIRKSNNLSEAEFHRQLANEGITPAGLREKIRRDLTIQQIQRGMVQQRIRVSDLEIDTFLKSADAQFWISPEFHLGHILVALPQAPTANDIERAERKANELYDKLSKGAVFAEVAMAESEASDALQGGDLGFRKSGDLPSLFAEIAPTLEPGQVSKPARSGAGFHILKLYDKRGDEQQVVTQSKVRHILLKPSAILTNEEAEAKLKKIRRQILEGADFAKLAKEHSEDIGSMLGGGDLGWSNPGSFVPEFERAIAETPVGEISQPFRSQFGWHILQVQDQRQEDLTAEVLRDKAARILTSRRFEDELQIWLRELRDDTYVEVKI